MNSKKKIVAAISGGVDSSVAAAIYKEKGYEVIGVTLKMKSCDENTEKRKSCCGIDDDLHARTTADSIGIAHYFLDVREDFTAKVLKKGWEEYASGRTPNPCALCNRYLKFGRLLDYARKIGAEGIITGHYSIVRQNAGPTYSLHRGIDSQKDQSYFLFALTQEQLASTHMPLGTMTKKEVREYARRIGLPNAEKTESQDACFGIGDEAFSETLRRLFNGLPQKGFIIGDDGKALGEHNGIHLYTIGQRKGLGIALGKPAYVWKIDKGNVYLSADEGRLFSENMLVENVNWQCPAKTESFECEVQIRYRSKPVKAKLTPCGASSYMVDFEKQQRAVTPGQAAVFYDGDKLLGGGWIS
ncbi:MAG: tRNA 2-thiouridine(34) synthase MnmA [Lentisphaerae bacterium GWF2_44_16]|nr:MAG: tRNA 2-thiouridine(34) synthase MnmA [Lentisphaerae bacterium GWF2_44_16]